jgi:hypothetical protein
MAQRNVNVKVGGESGGPTQWVVGRAFAYQSSIWRVKGLYFTSTPAGGRDQWWILGEQETEVTDLETGGEG